MELCAFALTLSFFVCIHLSCGSAFVCRRWRCDGVASKLSADLIVLQSIERSSVDFIFFCVDDFFSRSRSTCRLRVVHSSQCDSIECRASAVQHIVYRKSLTLVASNWICLALVSAFTFHTFAHISALCFGIRFASIHNLRRLFALKRAEISFRVLRSL